MKKTIHVLLTTVSPQHTAYPDNSVKRYGENGMYKVQATNKKFVKGKAMPCHPSNGFRGELRRFATSRILDVLKSRGEKIDAYTLTGLYTGASEASPDTANNSIEELFRASQNVYMGLFGGGSRLLPSRYTVQDLDVVSQHNIECGVVTLPEDMLTSESNIDALRMEKDSEGNVRYLEESFFIRKDDLAQNANLEHVESVVEHGIEGVSTYISEVQAADNASKKEDSVSKKGVRNFQRLEQIASGVPMAMRIDLAPDLTDAQVGLMLLCLEDLFNNNYIGGFGRIGFGKVRVEDAVLDLGGEFLSQGNLPFYKNGTFTFGPEFNVYKEAAIEDVLNIDTEELVSYFKKLKK
ncbi:type IV CRISPR-associated protein Csf2 [Pseudoalteromonas sp. OFAV1]|jgi:CRISPR type IV-associated protein Csf2|uniref:type IV CRISPR-associated protein Csf2 n=1 Tax=Pseudoalteromonas sp. OFAV1 TaxID=2908892 RepID=UPI001F45A4EB|nr:type IV CRISPR-associated protein Csf2 [Pseudoalteromonas sp. OFAV1]MCF2903065.1 type IV CRISPR-associated protein Csf2 [Pseudoalteromonas sp. OFAV1]